MLSPPRWIDTAELQSQETRQQKIYLWDARLSAEDGKTQPSLTLPAHSQADHKTPYILGTCVPQSTQTPISTEQGRAGAVDAHLLILSVFKVDGVVSHAEDGEDKIDEGEDAVQPQESVSGGWEEESSEQCGRCVACSPAWHSVSHPSPPPLPSRTSLSWLLGPHPRDEKGSIKDVGWGTTEMRLSRVLKSTSAISASVTSAITVLTRGANKHDTGATVTGMLLNMNLSLAHIRLW